LNVQQEKTNNLMDMAGNAAQSAKETVQEVPIFNSSNWILCYCVCVNLLRSVCEHQACLLYNQYINVHVFLNCICRLVSRWWHQHKEQLMLWRMQLEWTKI